MYIYKSCAPVHTYTSAYTNEHMITTHTHTYKQHTCRHRETYKHTHNIYTHKNMENVMAKNSKLNLLNFGGIKYHILVFNENKLSTLLLYLRLSFPLLLPLLLSLPPSLAFFPFVINFCISFSFFSYIFLYNFTTLLSNFNFIFYLVMF